MKSSKRRKKYWRRKLRDGVLKLLPKPLFHWWIRRSLDLLITQSNSEVKFEIATNIEDLKSALSLVQMNFVREGYAPAGDELFRVTPYHLLPETVVIVAKIEGKVVATISVIPRTLFGVPLEGVISLENFAKDKGKIVEISALAVDPAARGVQGEVLFNLMKYMYHFNKDVLKANTEVIGVNPKMVPLYEAVLVFQKIPNAEVVAYEFANGAPVVPMHFSLDTALQSYAKVFQGQPARRNMMEFFLANASPQFSLPPAEQLNQILPQRKPEEFRQFLQMRPKIFNELTSAQLATLVNLYQPWPECARLIQEVAGVRS